MKPKILDLFCGAGGASMGYCRAGFEVEGVDNKPQPHYPFKFHLADALEFPLEGYDAYHASPPCQFASVMRKGRWQDRTHHPNLIPATRKRLQATGKPYIIENVPGARSHLINPIMLCGTMFGLSTKEGNQLRRHRYFECNGFWLLVPLCAHNQVSAIGVYGGGQHPLHRTRKPKIIGVWGHTGGSSKRDRCNQFGIDARREAMGINWMINSSLNQAIPPAYTEYIGKRLIKIIKGDTTYSDGFTDARALAGQ